MALAVITPPAGPVVSLAEVKANLNMPAEREDLDAFLTDTVEAVQDWLAGPNGWLGRALGEATLEFTLPAPDGWPAIIRLPRPPFIAMVSVKSVDESGTETTIASSAYRISTGSDGLARLGGLSTWPSPAWGDELKIRYRAGYPAGTLDAGLRRAVLMSVARLYENRGDGLGSEFRDDPFVQDLFAPYRVWGP